jgi:hypothetical protein
MHIVRYNTAEETLVLAPMATNETKNVPRQEIRESKTETKRSPVNSWQTRQIRIQIIGNAKGGGGQCMPSACHRKLGIGV